MNYLNYSVFCLIFLFFRYPQRVIVSLDFVSESSILYIIGSKSGYFGLTIFQKTGPDQNLRLININEQDPGSIYQKQELNQRTERVKSGFFNKKPVLAFVLTIFFVATPLYAYAGFFSFLKDIFNQTTIIFQKDEFNSQNMALLQAAVNTNPHPSKGGGGIVIAYNNALLPESGPQSVSTDNDLGGFTGPKSDQISVYVVREGDSLSQIAKMFGVSVKTVMWANDIGSKGLIRPGETLVILPISGVQHTVVKNDTLAKIAKKYDGDIEEIIELNGFKEEHVLTIGDKVIVPGGEMSIEPTTVQQRSYAKTVSTPTRSYSGYYIRPLVGGVKTQGIHGYNAVDIAATHGTPILASASGEVILSKYAAGNPWFGGYGNYIVVQHDNGTQTVYAHLSQTLVKRGWKVVQGQVIGYMGSTGRSTGTHIHFEIRGAVNPF